MNARRLLRNPLSAGGLAVVVLFLLLGIFAPIFTHYDPNLCDLGAQLVPPSGDHLLGTDSLGRDLFARILYGARMSIPIGFAVVFLALAVGMLVGCTAGYAGGVVDEALMRLTDLFLAFPALILAMAVAGALGPSLFNSLIALGVAWWPPYARLVRAQVMGLRNAHYVEAARTMGASHVYILFRHIMPNCLGPVVVQGTLDLGGVILTAAGLSFIGLGVQPPDAEWGSMVSMGRLYIASHWWVSTFPGLAILMVVMGFNLFGDGLRDVLDPRQKSRRTL